MPISLDFLSIILIVFYGGLAVLAIKKLKFFNVPPINSYLPLIFILKLVAALIYIALFELYWSHGDIWGYFKQGLLWREAITEDPGIYLKLIFGSNPGYGIPEEYVKYFYPNHHVYWNSNGSNLMVRFNSIFSFLTFKKFYPIAVFFSFLSFSGLVGLYKVLNASYPSKWRGLLFSVFLIPMDVLWNSGPHKDAIMVCVFGLLIYLTWKIALKGFSLQRLILFALAAFICYLMRNYFAVVLFPSLIAFYICLKFNTSVWLSYLLLFFFGGICVLFVLPTAVPGKGYLSLMVLKQEQFLLDKGNSPVPLIPLEPKVSSIVSAIPNALFNTLIRPTPNDLNTKAKYLTVINNYLIILFIILAIIFMKIKGKNKEAILPFLLIVPILILIQIGLVVPNLGAISRYKSVIMPLLISFFVIVIDFQAYKKLKL